MTTPLEAVALSRRTSSVAAPMSVGVSPASASSSDKSRLFVAEPAIEVGFDATRTQA